MFCKYQYLLYMFHVVLFITSGGWVEFFIVLNFVALAPGNIVVVRLLW